MRGSPEKQSVKPESGGESGVKLSRFQVEISVSAYGYLELDASDAETARKMVQRLDASVEFGFQSDVDTSLFDAYAYIKVDGVELVEEEDHSGSRAQGNGTPFPPPQTV